MESGDGIDRDFAEFSSAKYRSQSTAKYIWNSPAITVVGVRSDRQNPNLWTR